MTDYTPIITDLERQLKLPEGLLAAVVQHESGGNPNAVSPVGAIGLTQLMPATAKSLGVDPYDPVQNLTGGARYLRQQLDKFGSVPLALAAYNAGPGAVAKYNGVPPYAETQRYVSGIVASLPRGGTAHVAGGPGPIAATGPAPSALPTLAPLAPLEQTPALVTALNRTNKLLGLPALPNFSVRAPAVPAVRTPQQHAAAAAPAQADITNVVLAPNADRHGVSTHPQVLGFLSTVASIYGQPLTVGTGTNHNEYVKGSRRESAHWTGWAADVPAEGADLTKLGYSALLAAGMAPKQAVKAAARGGLYNVNGYQVIFKTNVGGNHWNHLHVGLAPSRQHAAA